MGRASLRARRAKAREDLKMAYGLPPFADPGNPYAFDGRYIRGLEVEYDMTIEELERWSGLNRWYDMIDMAYAWMRDVLGAGR